MARKPAPNAKLAAKIEKLAAELKEARDTLDAIYSGQVDALVVKGPGGDQVFTLRGAEEPYRILVEQMQEGAVMLDGDGIILYCNQRLADMLQIELEKAIGSPLASFLPFDQLKRLQAVLNEGREGRGHGELILQAAGGDELTVTIAAATMILDGIKVLGLVVTDVSEQKARAQEMARYQNQLRAMTIALSQTEQRERRILAQTLHDNLQQLLVAAKLQLNATCKPIGTGESALAIHSAEDLVDQAIQASRSLTLELSPPVLYTQGFAAALVWLADWMKKKHRLTVDIQTESHTDQLSDDIRAFLFQVARELLFNVVKHSGSDRATVVFTRPDSQSVQLMVEDKGTGFDAAAFDSNGHEGFGLFSVRERILMLGGEIDVQSAPGQGTRVTINVPLESEAADESQAEHDGSSTLPPGERSESLTGEAPPSGARKIRVALADDHQIFRESLVRMLGDEADFEVVGQAADGHAAVELAHRVKPDVFIMDVGMQRLDGVKATKLIMNDLPQTRIIGLSMHDEESIARAMRQAGADSFLTKDGSFENLLKAIRNGGKSQAFTYGGKRAAEAL